MEHQKIISLLGNKPNQPSKFRTKIWVEINDDSRRTCNTNNQIEFKTLMLNSSLCDYRDTHTLVKGTISVAPAPPPSVNPHSNDREVAFCAPFTDCISEINNTQIGNAKNINVVMPMYKLIGCSDNIQKQDVYGSAIEMKHLSRLFYLF